MSPESKPLSYEELQSQVENLQAEVTRFIVVKQELIDTQALLDREQSRFKGILECSEELLRADDLETFITILLESILATFEFEVSLFTQFDSQRRCLDVISQIGFEDPPNHLVFDFDSLEGNTGVILPKGHALLKQWSSLDLGEAILCPYFSGNDHTFAGLVIGGLTTENLNLYDPINSEVVSSFSVMVTQAGSLLRNSEVISSFSVMINQAGSLLRNYELKSKLQEQNLQLEHYSKNLEQLVEERTMELSQANKELDLLYQQNLDHLHLTREELSYQELLAQTDELTGLYNRRCFDTQLDKFVELSMTTGEQFGLLLLDLDNFKLTNDTYGHPHGDFVLKEVAQVLRKSCRQTDLICRLGGDEFAVIMPGISMSRGKEVAEQIRCHIEMLPKVEPDSKFNITASLGGTLHTPSESPGDLISRVDEHLYKAKRSGRNQVVWKDKTSDETTA